MLQLPLPPRDSLVWLLLSWLIVWRLTALVVLDNGPFEAIAKLRYALARRGLRMILCFHCTAMWVALLVTALLFEWRWLTIAIALATAGAASATERFLGGSTSDPWDDDNQEESDD